MPKGTVKWFDSRKGYGFIAQEDGGEDVFVHQTAIKSEGYRTLYEGQIVEFDIVTEVKGAKALNVQVIGETKTSTDNKIKVFRQKSRENLRTLEKKRQRR